MRGCLSTVAAPRDSEPRVASELTEAEERFLQAVTQHPGLPSGAYAKLARMNAKRALICRRRLVSLEYLREHAVATGKRGRNAIVLEPTEKAGHHTGVHGDPAGGTP